jgi:hypothetical protein
VNAARRAGLRHRVGRAVEGVELLLLAARKLLFYKFPTWQVAAWRPISTVVS